MLVKQTSHTFANATVIFMCLNINFFLSLELFLLMINREKMWPNAKASTD